MKAVIFLILFFVGFTSCKENLSVNNLLQDESLANVDTFHINENLKQSSLDFINTNKINNSIIEVDIDKKEYNQIYITFTCKGVSYFIVKKLKPLFTYELNNNTFFVFTGAEEMLNLPFDETKYKNRRQERCDTILRTWYVFEDGKMRKEDSPTFFEPFSNMPPPREPPPVKKNTPKFNPSKFQTKH